MPSEAAVPPDKGTETSRNKLHNVQAPVGPDVGMKVCSWLNGNARGLGPSMTGVQQGEAPSFELAQEVATGCGDGRFQPEGLALAGVRSNPDSVPQDS